MTQLEQDEDSLQIVVKPPAAEQLKISKQIIKDFELKTNTDHNRFDIYLTVNKVYIQNLISRRQKPKLSAQIRNQLGANCILYKQFSLDKNQCKQFLGKVQTVKGNIHILYNSQVSVEFKVYFDKQVKRTQDYSWLYFHYCSLGVWKSKSFTLSQQRNKLSCKVPIEDFNDYVQPNLLVNISIRRKQTSNSSHLGIINLGNTCFMNSCLQMLFYVRPLRKIILQSKSRTKVVSALKDVFTRLLDTQEKRAVDVQNLLQSYEKYNQVPRSQQDVQEFLLDFINQIQKQCPQVRGLWQGKCSQTTYSQQKTKPYKSTQIEEFAQLDVHMFDSREKYYQNIEESLQYLLTQQEVEEMVENDQFGKINVAKCSFCLILDRTFQSLPDVLFINLKRYFWNKQKMRLSKIFSHIEYGQDLNMGFLTGTPGNTVPNPQCDYSLFSVIVHKGTSPHNGHYFVFINTSENCQQPQWVQFNDSMVRLSDSDEVLKFTGKKNTQTILDKNIGRFVQKQLQSDESSYLLVYIRKAMFNQYQSIQTPIPKEYIKQKLKKAAEREKLSLHQLNIYKVSDFDQMVDLFQSGLQHISLPLPKDQSLKVQLKKISKAFLATDAKYMYRVYVNQKKLKPIYQYQTPFDIAKYRRGHQNCDYILILSEQIKKQGQIRGKQFYAVLCISKNQLKDDINLPSMFLVTPEALAKLQNVVQTKGGIISYLTDKEDFIYGWNLYLQIQISKPY